MIAPSTEYTVLTIGYEGLDLPQFVKYMKWHKVKILIDVREIPLSRKKGFSKTALGEAMSTQGIGYTHIKALGSPKPMRTQLKEDWDYDAFFTAYENYLNDQNEALDVLHDIVQNQHTVCLLCFEQRHDQCHRSRVANRIAETFPGSVTVEPVKTWL